jgi:23S rRNA (cytosine1962-C5)-methyltransferase
LHGHDWLFSSEVLKVFGKPADGDVISLKDGKDRLIGIWNIYVVASKIQAPQLAHTIRSLVTELK